MATDTEKDVAYYLEHPEEVDPANTELVQKILAAASDTAGTTEEKPKSEEPDKEAAAKEAEAKAAAEAEAAKTKAAADALATKSGGTEEAGKTGEDKAPVQTRDGKHVLPFTVLEKEREGRAAAEAALTEAMAANVAIAKQLKALQDGRVVPDAEADAAGKSAAELEAELAKVREDAPWLVPTLEKLIGMVRATEEQLAQLQTVNVDSDAAYHASLQKSAGEALAGNATLLLWKSERPDLYDEAVSYDKWLRSDGNPLGKPFLGDNGSVDYKARFDHCVNLVRGAHLGQDLPLPQAIEEKPAPGAQKVAPDPAAIKKAAQDKLAAAADKPSVTTISDIPGGAPAAQDEQAAIAAMSVSALGAQLMNFSPEKLQSWLARNAN